MFLIIGVIGLLMTIYLLIKQYETRMVLFMAGLIMTLIALDPMAGFKAFSGAMKGAKIIEIITSSMAFAMVLEYTKCDKHLVHFLANGLKKAGPALLIPGAVIVTAFVHISVPSAAGCVAAVGSVIIPILIGSGVHPVMAASTVFAGTYGASHLSPGFHQNAIIAQAIKGDPVAVVGNHFVPVLIVGAVVAAMVTVVAYVLKEHKGYDKGLDNIDFKVDYIKAVVPVLPLVLIILGAMKFVPPLKSLAISHAMIIGTMVACLVTRTSPGEISKAFFKGLGNSFGSIYGIIICAAVFVAGLNSLGLIKTMISFMSSNPAFAKITGTFGPFLLAVICGSGDAASIAFNSAVTPHAVSFGIVPMNLGSVAAIGGALGRSMSPIAGAAMVCCGLAGINNPMDLAKRNALPMIAGTITLYVLMMLLR